MKHEEKRKGEYNPVIKKCKNCGEQFEALKPLQQVCSRKCAFELLNKKKESESKKAWRKEKSEIKERLKTKSEHLKELQTVFNTYIRERDKGKPCISCNRILTGKYDAGHFYSVGAYPNLRFNEDNCFGQCVHCNQHLHGNIAEYSLNLPLRIGQERFDKLAEMRNVPLKLSIEEIKELKIYYKNLTKNLHN